MEKKENTFFKGYSVRSIQWQDQEWFFLVDIQEVLGFDIKHEAMDGSKFRGQVGSCSVSMDGRGRDLKAIIDWEGALSLIKMSKSKWKHSFFEWLMDKKIESQEDCNGHARI